MAEFKVEVTRVLDVQDHPNADRLSLISIKGYTCISAKLEDGSHRYQINDLVVYIPEASVLPNWLLKEMEFWDDENQKGTLSGHDGNRVKAIRLRGIFSEGILYPVINNGINIPYAENGVMTSYGVNEDDDVANILGIAKYEPPIPESMSGEVVHTGHTLKYDFDAYESEPDILNSDDIVVATEKLHGTFCQIAYIPGLNNAEVFFDGNLIVGSKGLSAQGLTFKNNDNNKNNVYVKNLNTLLSDGFGKNISDLSATTNAPIYVFGEIFGKGIQDLTYGLEHTDFRVFDIRIGNEFLDYDNFLEVAAFLRVKTVPLIYKGKFDYDTIISCRDGNTTLGETNMREGVVVKSMCNHYHTKYGRKITKFVSPAYKLRKGKKGVEVTELN